MQTAEAPESYQAEDSSANKNAFFKEYTSHLRVHSQVKDLSELK